MKGPSLRSYFIQLKVKISKKYILVKSIWIQYILYTLNRMWTVINQIWVEPLINCNILVKSIGIQYIIYTLNRMWTFINQIWVKPLVNCNVIS